MTRTPYPLQWPDGWARTPPARRQRARFITGMSNATADVLRQLKLLGGRRLVVTTNMPVRNDGLPYATGREPEDPGVAVWWVDRQGREAVLACDRWRLLRDNMTAIAKSLEALRGLERWGASEMIQRAFAGFAALPPGTPAAPEPRNWREVLGGEWNGVIEPDEIVAVARARHRRLIRTAHPDVAGGDPAAAAEINAALDDAEAWYRRATTQTSE